MRFQVGDCVQLISDPARVGEIKAIGSRLGPIQYYDVFWGGNTQPRSQVEEQNLRLFREDAGEIPGGWDDFQRLMTLRRLSRRAPLQNSVYALNASRTRFFPYQFKPLLKLLESPTHRLLIADEVGLGKTIEAGLIYTELKARQPVHRVLIICPAGLKRKWRQEMRSRFGEDFDVLDSGSFIQWMDDYEESGSQKKLNGIIALESIRQERVLSRLMESPPDIDLAIFDEAHHLRTFGRMSRRAAEHVCNASAAVLMLSATPVQLGQDNLYSLFNLMAPDEFPDLASASSRFDANKHIVRAGTLLRSHPPKLREAREQLREAARWPWFSQSANSKKLLSELADRLEMFEQAGGPEAAERVQALRDVEEMNLLGHILSRTRKRDVHGTARRKPFAVSVDFTPAEMGLYNAVTKFVRAEAAVRDLPPGAVGWLLNTPQRIAASCLPALAERYLERHGHDEISDNELDDMQEEWREVGCEETIFFNPSVEEEYRRAEIGLADSLRKWVPEARDSKLAKLLEVLHNVRQQDGGRAKVMLFAFFKGTLRYLEKQLTAAGFRAVRIDGDVPMEERQCAIAEFRDSSECEVLLSSKVGSEGLDFQFCNTMINYDLPWNPMDVEQRIGRLDRIGQKSEVIRIFNFWVQDTIEQRILQRLYDRIGVFEDTIGSLEGILGSVMRELEQSLFSRELTPEEESEEARKAEDRIEFQRHEIDTYEKHSADLFADDYYTQQLEMVQKCRRYVTARQTRSFVEDFLARICPKSSLRSVDADGNIFVLRPASDLIDFLRGRCDLREIYPLLAAEANGLQVTFDSGIAFEQPKVEFVNVLHPLVGAICSYFAGKPEEQRHSFCVRLRSELVSSGIYFFGVFELHIRSARPATTLEFVLLDNGTALDSIADEEGEQLLGELVERGENLPVLPSEELLAQGAAAVPKIKEVFERRLAARREAAERSNDLLVDRRLASAQAYYEKRIAILESQVQRGVAEGKSEKYLRLTRSKIPRAVQARDKQYAEIEAARRVTTEFNLLATGVLEVLHPMGELV